MGRCRAALVVCVVLIGLFGPAGSPVQGQTRPTAGVGALEDPFEADLRAYREAPDPKAFAIGGDEDGVVWGFVHSAESAEDAMRGALVRCAIDATEQGIEQPCEVALIGNTYVLQDAPDESATEQEDVAVPIADRPVVRERAEAPSPGEIWYEERWVEGQFFQVGSAGDLQVWASMFKKPLRAMVWVVNAGDTAFLFRPKDLRLVAHKERGSELLRTWGAEEYERKERRKQAIAAALYAFATSYSNQPQPRTSTFSGNTFGYGYNGTFSGTITTWPTAQDYAAANARTQAQVSAMANQLESEFQAMAEMLLRPHTLEPGTTYGGVVHFEKEAALGYTLEVNVGGEQFKFGFTRSGTASSGMSGRPVNRAGTSAIAPASASSPEADLNRLDSRTSPAIAPSPRASMERPATAVADRAATPVEAPNAAQHLASFQLKTWIRALNEIDELLKQGDPSQASSRLDPLIEELLAEAVAGPVADLLAAASFTKALALAASGSDYEALWYWSLARSLEPMTQGQDFEARLGFYGDAGRQLRAAVEERAEETERPVARTDAMSAPEPIERAMPRTPAHLTESGGEVRVPVRFVIGADGEPRDPEVLEEEGLTLAFACLEAVRSWRYRPALLAGEPVAVYSKITCRFVGGSEDRPSGP